MNAERYDLVILGGGPGGYPAAIRASQLGLKVAVVEKYKVGGTCLHWGCIPSKVILEAAEVVSMMQRAQEYGASVGDVSVDYSQVARRRERVVSTHTSGIEFLFKKRGVTLIRGEGRLTSPTSVAVQLAEGGTTEVSGADVIIATGSVARSLPGLAVDGDRVINSDHATTLSELPGSVVIVGGGYIGVEFASAWRDMGVEVTVVEVMPRIIPLEDREVADELGKQLGRRGIRILAGARVLTDTVRIRPDRVELEVERDGSRESLTAERLLVATGRGPATEGIGLERVNVRLDRGFVQVDGQMRTGVPHLYAVGDVVGGLMLAHKATAEGLIAVESIVGRNPRPLDSLRIPRCIYCRPQVASMGLSEDEAREQGRRVKVGRFPFRANSMATILAERDGFAKIVADEETLEVLGVQMIGPRVTELIHGPALARLLESTTEEVAATIYPHPTLSEVLRESAEDVEGLAIHFAR